MADHFAPLYHIHRLDRSLTTGIGPVAPKPGEQGYKRREEMETGLGVRCRCEFAFELQRRA
jgi:hypothetical protein